MRVYQVNYEAARENATRFRQLAPMRTSRGKKRAGTAGGVLMEFLKD
jgi:hypothetical protein